MWEVSLYVSGFHKACATALCCSHIKHPSVSLYIDSPCTQDLHMHSPDTYCTLFFFFWYYIKLSVWGVYCYPDDCLRTKGNCLFRLFSHQKYRRPAWYKSYGRLFPKKQSAFLKILRLVNQVKENRSWLHFTKCGHLSSLLPFWIGLPLSWSSLQAQIKCPLFQIEQKKQWPWIFPLACLYPLEYSKFRKSAFFLISQMWIALVHFLCFSHTEHSTLT